MTFDELMNAGGIEALQAFKRVWFDRQQLKPKQEKVLRDLFERYPLGQTNFKMWLKNTTRNLLAKDISMKANNGAAASILNKA